VSAAPSESSRPRSGWGPAGGRADRYAPVLHSVGMRRCYTPKSRMRQPPDCGRLRQLPRLGKAPNAPKSVRAGVARCPGVWRRQDTHLCWLRGTRLGYDIESRHVRRRTCGSVCAGATLRRYAPVLHSEEQDATSFRLRQSPCLGKAPNAPTSVRAPLRVCGGARIRNSVRMLASGNASWIRH
jgi:hypothetical protein